MFYFPASRVIPVHMPIEIESVIAYIQDPDFPTLSRETRNVLTIVKQRLPRGIMGTEFSKEHIIQKITEYGQRTRTLAHLESSQCQSRCVSISRGVLNISCLAGAALSAALTSNCVGQIFGAFGFSLGYTIAGVVNYYYENPQRSEQEFDPACGMACGPYFAAHEAIYRVPERIQQARRDEDVSRDDIISDFYGLVSLARYQEQENPLRNILIVTQNRLQTEIDNVAKLISSINQSSLEDSAKTLLERVVVEETAKQQEFQKNLASCQNALTELDALISYIRRKILTQVFLRDVDLPVGLPIVNEGSAENTVALSDLAEDLLAPFELSVETLG